MNMHVTNQVPHIFQFDEKPSKSNWFFPIARAVSVRFNALKTTNSH